MEMNPLCQIRQGTGIRLGAAVQELLHIVPAGELQWAGELSIDRMIHDDVQYSAAVVHHGVELRLYAGGTVAADNLTQKASR